MDLTPAQMYLLKHPDLVGLPPPLIMQAFRTDQLRVCFASEIPTRAYDDIIKKYGALPDFYVQPYATALVQDPGTWHLYEDRITRQEQLEFQRSNPELSVNGEMVKKNGDMTQRDRDLLSGKCIDNVQMEMACVYRTLGMLEELEMEDTPLYDRTRERLDALRLQVKEIAEAPAEDRALKDYFEKTYIHPGIFPPSKFPGMSEFFRIFVEPTRPHLKGSPDIVIHRAICTYILENAKPAASGEKPDVVTREVVESMDDLLGFGGLDALP